MNVRKYLSADREALVALWSRTFPDPPVHHAAADVIDRKLSVDDLIYVAIKDEALIGACIAGYDGHRGWLYSVATLPDRRREGAGTALVMHAIEALGELGCTKLNLQVRGTNAGVVAFYESLGFVQEDRISLGLRL